MKFVLLLLGCLMLAGPAWGQSVESWTTGGFEASPDDGDAVSAGAGKIRATRLETRERAEAELCWSDNDTTGCTTADDGRLRNGAARVFMDTSEPSAIEAPDRAGVTTLDDGRIWCDGDSPSATVHLCQVYQSGFESIQVAEAVALTDMTDVDDQVLAGSHNLIYNGSFEATDGTGDSTSTTVPDGWALVLTPTVGYTDPTGDVRWGDGFHVDLTNAGADSEGIQQELDGLACGTTFKVIARAQDDSTNTCKLDVAGEGGTAFSASSTAGDGAWTTLSGTFGTTACGTLDDDVLIQLTSEGATNAVCEFDNVAVYQVGDTTTDRDEVSYPAGPQIVFDDNNGAAQTAFTGSFGNVTGINDLTVTAPGPGYTLTVTGSIGFTFNAAANPGQCDARIQETTSGGVTRSQQYIRHSMNSVTTGGPVNLAWVETNIAPGTPRTFSLDGQETAGACLTQNTTDSWLMVRLEPTR